MFLRAKGFFVAAFFAASVLTNTAAAVDVEQSADVSVRVSSVFSLTLDTSTIDFGSVRPGEWKEVSSAAGYANVAACSSNTGNPWYLQIKATGPLSSATASIPIENLKWMTTYAGSKNPPYPSFSDGLTHQAAEGFQDFSLVDQQVFYSANASLMTNNNTLPNGAEIQFKYAVFVPDTIKLNAEAYSTTIVYTMTE